MSPGGGQPVAGGGAYFLISRVLGPASGGAIGLALYLSQAISVAFYIIAFAQAFEPLYVEDPPIHQRAPDG